MKYLIQILTVAFLLVPTTTHAFTNSTDLYASASNPVLIGDVVYAVVEYNGGIINNWNASSATKFNDLESTHSKYGYILEAEHEGWIDCAGASSCNINVDTPITRGQLVSILIKSRFGKNGWQNMGLGQAPSYVDLTYNHKYADLVRIAADRCIISGTASGHIDPDGTVSRMDAIDITNKAYQDAVLVYNNDCAVHSEEGLVLSINSEQPYSSISAGSEFIITGTSYDGKITSAEIYGLKPNQVSCEDRVIFDSVVEWNCSAKNTGYDPSSAYFTINKVNYEKSNVLTIKIIPGTKAVTSYAKSSSSKSINAQPYNLSDKASFPDVEPGSAEGNAASALQTLGIISGYPDGEFKGTRSVNRAEAAKMLIIASKITKLSSPNYGQFPDVKSEHWFGPYVMTAAKNGIINGNPDGFFRPGNTINTAEFLKMISRTFGAQENTDYPYRDVKADDWFARYAGVAYSRGLFPDRYDYLTPADTLTRSEVAIAIYMYLLNK